LQKTCEEDLLQTTMQHPLYKQIYPVFIAIN